MKPIKIFCQHCSQYGITVPDPIMPRTHTTFRRKADQDALGHPIRRIRMVCEVCGDDSQTCTDFGYLQGIKKTKGFAAKVIAPQKQELTARRKAIKLAEKHSEIGALECKRDKISTWRGPAEKAAAQVINQEIAAIRAAIHRENGPMLIGAN